MRLINILLLLILLLLGSCIDRFVPDTTRYDDMIFIECLVNNDTTTRSRLLISQSAPLYTYSEHSNAKPQKLSGAVAGIICNDGNEFPFDESAPGTYLTASDFIPEPGKSYKLFVLYDGNIFESNFEKMRAASPIDSITYKTVLDKRSEDGITVSGYRFFTSTHQDAAGISYYRWSMDATYLFSVPYTATHIWNGKETLPASNDSVKTCFFSKNITGIYVASTSGLAENRIINAPLHFESQYGEALSIRYSLHVKQLSISESAYRFWNDLSKLVDRAGGLYEIQPFSVRGNVFCTTESDVKVAGIFEVAGVTDTRIFADRPTDFKIIPFTCYQQYVGTRDYPWYRVPKGAFLTLDLYTLNYLISSADCYDCTLRGGYTTRPPFWEDH